MRVVVYLIIISQTFGLNIRSYRQIATVNRDLLPHKKVYMIDIDETICNTKNSDYYNSIPIYKNIHIFNKLFDNGHEINYWTARGANSGINWDKHTIRQFRLWNVKFSSINMDKPHYDIWIDDKALNVEDIQTIEI